MTTTEAKVYHRPQIELFGASQAEPVSAFTINYTEEALGLCCAAKRIGIPAAISFTVETDGRLPSSEPLGKAIETVEEATGGYPLCYMINCAHSSPFEQVLTGFAP